jgi:hypothetical protein
MASCSNRQPLPASPNANILLKANDIPADAITICGGYIVSTGCILESVCPPVPCSGGDCTGNEPCTIYAFIGQQSPTPIPTPTATPCSSCISPKVTYYRQCDTAWNPSPPLGNPTTSKETICKGGCLLTCFSMIAGLTPLVMDDALQESFDSNNNLNPWSVGEEMAWSIPSETYADSNILDALCKTSHPQLQYVIADILTVNATDHFILVTGQQYDPNTKRCRFTVLDPADKSAQYLDDTTRYPQVIGLKIVIKLNS